MTRLTFITGLIGAVILLIFIIIAVFAQQIAPGDPLEMVGRPLLTPFADSRFPLGTNQLGRDVWAGLVHGARVSLTVGAVAAAAVIGVGIFIGTLSGFLGGFVDNVLMRITEAVQSIPAFLLALALVSVLGASATSVVIAIALSSWPPSARLVRAEVMRVRTLDYVDAARVVGRTPLAIAFMEVLPSALQPVVALIGITVGEAILVESALAFLGLSDPNLQSWGLMVASGRATLRVAPLLVILPGLAIALAALSVSLSGDALAARLGEERQA
jgi:peptide/nickel transport system permease protein